MSHQPSGDVGCIFCSQEFLADLSCYHTLVQGGNHQGGLRSRPLCKLACQILLWYIPSRRASSGAPRQEGPSIPSRGLEISPPTRTVETVGLASEGAQLIDSGLSNEVVETLLNSRAPSTRKLYALKWKVFTSWCSDHQLDPVNCQVGTVLEFLQDRFTAGLAPSTLKVYVAAISAYHIHFGGMSLGKDSWYLVFLRGTLRLRCYKPSVLLLSDCGPGKAHFALPNVGIRCLLPQSWHVA